MSETNFTEILQKVSPLKKKQDTLMRNSMSPEDRLVPVTTLSKIIPEVCDTVQSIEGRILEGPDTAAWLAIAHSFEKTWKFSNCLGALDGKHANFKAPPNSGSTYFNYQGTTQFEQHILQLSRHHPIRAAHTSITKSAIVLC